VPRMLRSAISAFTRVFDGLWRCAADPGSIAHSASAWVPAVRCIVRTMLRIAERTLHRVRDARRIASHSLTMRS
jgi:hypothetical protein